MISDNSTTTSSDEYSDGSTGMGLRFEPVTCSTPKRKDYKSPEMPEKRRRAPVYSTDVSMMPKVARVVRLRNGGQRQGGRIANRQSAFIPSRQDQSVTRNARARRPISSYGPIQSQRESQNEPTPSIPKGLPKHPCSICSKSFYHFSSLQVHLLLHSGTLPRKSYRQSKNEEIHEESSSDDQEVTPKKAPKNLDTQEISPKMAKPVRKMRKSSKDDFYHRFELNLTNLDEKMKKKNEEKDKKYSCSMCGKLFNKKTSMRIHQTKRHVHTREFLIFV